MDITSPFCPPMPKPMLKWKLAVGVAETVGVSRIDFSSSTCTYSADHNRSRGTKTQSSHTLATTCSQIIPKRKRRKRKSANPAPAPASDILHLMDSLHLPIPPDIYISLIRECTLIADFSGAHHLHNHITRSALNPYQPALPLLNRLLLMHASSARLDIARHLFDGMPSKDFKSWATIIVSYVNNADYHEAITLFLKMLHHIRILEFPAWIMVCLLNVCVSTTNMELGRQLHACSLKLGHASNSLFASCLINFYGKFRCLESANLVFNQLPRHNALTWMARLINNTREELFFQVFRDFEEIGKEGMKKNASMFSSVLKACARVNDHGKCGQQVHADVIKLGFDTDAYIECGLVDMYGRSGLLRDAKRVFEMSSNTKNDACWNAMLGAYIRNELYLEAIKFVYEMKAAGLQLQQPLLDQLTIACGTNSLSKTLPHEGL